jgi:hypothetical protein
MKSNVACNMILAKANKNILKMDPRPILKSMFLQHISIEKILSWRKAAVYIVFLVSFTMTLNY